MDFLAPGHLIVVAVVALVVLVGSKRLPDMSRNVGRSMRIFKAEIGALASDEADSHPTPVAPTAPIAEASTPSASHQPADVV